MVGPYLVAGGVAGVDAGVDGAGVLAAGGASGFDVGVAGRTGAAVPLTTELPPRCPMIDNVSARTMKSTAATVVALVRSVAPERAPNAA